MFDRLCKAPCCDCHRKQKTKSAICHDTCKEYLTWREKRKAFEKEIKENRKNFRSDNIVAYIFKPNKE